MSDIFEIRPIVGNFGNRESERKSQSPFPGKRRLVEECEKISIYAVQRAFGKKALLEAVRQARTFRVPVFGGYFDLDLTYEAHRLPGRYEQWATLEDGTARLWLVCPSCLRKVQKLYYFHYPGTVERSPLLCRLCHGLVYQCSNCGGNRWYKQVARPFKALLKERDRLLARRDSSRVRARLLLIEAEIEALKKQVRPKTKRIRSDWWKSQRRPYRNIGLLE